MSKPKPLSPALKRRLKAIKILALDVDGILTDGRMWWVNGSGWTRAFHIRDGYGIVRLRKAGISIALLSGSDAADIRERAKMLDVNRAYLGSLDKGASFTRLLEDEGVSAPQVAYGGDDLFDLPALKAAGFSFTVPESPAEVRKAVDYVTTRPGGMGAVREIADLLLAVRG